MVKRITAILFLIAALLTEARAAALPEASGGTGAAKAFPKTNDHWAFKPPRRAALPSVKNAAWPRNGIDHFILARLDAEKISPSPEADRRTLIRRLSLDLLGVPPSFEQVEGFVNDSRVDAYERLVDTLLGSPEFGERWARDWLDLARYADSDGYEKDTPRPYAYLYRDWVIQAINDDLPFDEFSIEQLAGDLLPNATHEQKVATGFHRNTLTNKEGGVDQEEFRCKATVDRVSTTATVWLGLTLGCAECHNHKYDPLTQREFYQFYAFFNNAAEFDLPSPTPAELTAYRAAKDRWDLEHSRAERSLSNYVTTAMRTKQTNWEREASLLAESLWTTTTSKQLSQRPLLPAMLPETMNRLLRIPRERRTKNEFAEIERFYREQIDPEARRLKQALSDVARREPKFPETKAPTLVENNTCRKTQIHIRGDFLRKGDEVEAGTPAILPPLKPTLLSRLAKGEFDDEDSHVESSSETNPLPAPPRTTRLDLARWLVAPENPLTARVAANRIWYRLFGRGLVSTLDDFGVRGEKPSHPELLDWLATEFRRLGWSRKAFIKRIVTSATYRQRSTVRAELVERDPSNLLLARQNRLRLEAETIRDAYLAASGLLSRSLGGPSVRPPLPADIAALGYANSVRWQENQGADRYRRGLYIFFQRTVPYPMLVTFDAPDSNVTCTRRERSNTPLQALTLLNDPVFFECAQALGLRMARADVAEVAERIRFGFRASVGRPPTENEEKRLDQLFGKCFQAIGSDQTRAAKITGNNSGVASSPEAAALVAVARTILNMDEFVTRE